ncbi:MAG: ATP-binding cassette domain-containing protein [Parachlamydiaceae bacterium]
MLLFANRWAISCLGILLIQQVIEASSTIWLVKLMQSITQGENFIPYLVLCLSSLALAYVPLCIASILKITWKQEAQRSFIDHFVSFNKNKIADWNNRTLKEQKLATLTSEGPTVIHTVIDYVWDLYTYVLSVFLNVTALSIILEPLFSVTYGLSITCVFLVMKLKRMRQQELTQKALNARIELCQSLLGAWDNVLLGNEYNFELWREKSEARLNHSVKCNVALERFDQFLAIIVSLITSIPTLLVVLYFVMMHQHNPVELSSFIVALPLLFVNLSYTYQTLSLVFRWSMHFGKLRSIYQSIQPTASITDAMETKVKWPKITLSEPLQHPDSTPIPTTFEDILQKASSSCRLTLRGDNGCGKSTLLMLLKEKLAKHAFFLPTQNQLAFVSDAHCYSTGESLKNLLGEILHQVKADVLLLDEWDANLDKDNQEKLSHLIDQLAAKKCVIEVRHR